MMAFQGAAFSEAFGLHPALVLLVQITQKRDRSFVPSLLHAQNPDADTEALSRR